VRPSDIVARTGGDEFCAILFGATAAQANMVAERMIARARDVVIDGSITRISVGCAVVSGDDDRHARMAAAIAAVDKAKARGGSRVAMDPGAQVAA